MQGQAGIGIPPGFGVFFLFHEHIRPVAKTGGPLAQVARAFRQGQAAVDIQQGCSIIFPFMRQSVHFIKPFQQQRHKMILPCNNEFLPDEQFRRIEEGFVLGILVPPEIADPKFKQQASFLQGGVHFFYDRDHTACIFDSFYRLLHPVKG